MSETNSSDDSPVRPEYVSDIVSPETIEATLGAISFKLDDIAEAPDGSTYAEFTSVNQDNKPVLLRMRRGPVELNRYGVVTSVYTEPLVVHDSSHSFELGKNYLFVSRGGETALEQHSPYNPIGSNFGPIKSFDEILASMVADREQIWEDERKAGVAAVHETEAEKLLEMIERAKLHESYKSGVNTGSRIVEVLSRIIKNRPSS